MRIEKMLAALLAGLITLSLAGCAADKANDNTESGAVSTESSITATETDKASEPTAESSLPAGMTVRMGHRSKYRDARHTVSGISPSRLPGTAVRNSGRDGSMNRPRIPKP